MTDEQMLQYLKEAHAQKVTSLGREPSKYATVFSLAADRIETLEAKLATAVEELRKCLLMLDLLKCESERSIEYDEEDAFRMGEWFEPEDIRNMEQARALLFELEAKP